jgi:hypothetical protein
VLELLPRPPARVLELGFAGVHALPLRLAGYDVVVVEPDERQRARAVERAGEALPAVPDGAFDAVVVLEGVEPPPARRTIVVRQDGSVWSSGSS